MNFENALAYRWYGIYNWVGIHIWESESKLRELLLDLLAYPLVNHRSSSVDSKSNSFNMK